MLRDLWMSKSVTQARYTVADIEDTARCHKEIARCILEHRAEDACKAMEGHLLEGMKAVLHLFNFWVDKVNQQKRLEDHKNPPGFRLNMEYS